MNFFFKKIGHSFLALRGYVIYKIISTIKLADSLSKKYPNHNFIPVYWMASEDHDFDEIKSFYSLGKRYKWDIDTSGPVGDINPKSFAKILEKEPSVPSFFLEAYNSSKSLSEAVRKYMNFLFGEMGLVVLDPNSQNFKKSFIDVIEDDIINNSIFNIEKSSEVKSDVLVRKINFFFQDSKFRDRIERDKDYKILSTSKSFDEHEMKKLIPSSLLGRSIIIVFVPIIVLVTVTSAIFYKTSWNIISKRLCQSVVADINVIVKLIDQDLKFQAIKIANQNTEISIFW